MVSSEMVDVELTVDEVAALDFEVATNELQGGAAWILTVGSGVRDALVELEPVLRTYEGCASSYLGEIEDANIVKIHRFSGKVSYLAYPDFDSDPHPALMRSVKLNMRNLGLDCWDYVGSDNPPILHRKEAFLAKEDPRYVKFAKLTQQEERRGLLEDTAKIGTRNGWNSRLLEQGLELRGHRLVRRSAQLNYCEPRCWPSQ